MNLDLLVDFVNEATEEIAKYQHKFTLSSPNIRANQFVVPFLKWDSIRFGDAEKCKVPNDKRGIYAFAVCQLSDVLPPHGYILYIGIAGRDSNRSLRERYEDYLNEKKVIKLPRIAADDRHLA